MQPMHDWQELDDRYNMIDESRIEPDYYIDRPVSGALTQLGVCRNVADFFFTSLLAICDLYPRRGGQ